MAQRSRFVTDLCQLALASTFCFSGTASAAEPILVRDFKVEPLPRNSSIPQQLLAVGEKLFFSAEDPLHGRELWKSDGPDQGAKLVADLCPGVCGSQPRSFLAFGSSLIFVAEDSDHGSALWRTDGTLAGTSLVFEGAPGSGRFPLVSTWVVRGRLVILADDPAGTSLWSSDGTRAGTRRYFTFPRDGEPTVATIPDVTPGERLYFQMATPATGAELWSTDGTAAGTYSFGDLNAGRGNGFCGGRAVVTSERVEFGADRGGLDCELWTTDGSPAGTHLVVDLVGDGGSFPEGFTRIGARTFFQATTPDRGSELWVTDGTAGGTHPLEDIVPGSGYAFPNNLGKVGEHLIFTAFEGLRAIPFTTDGSPGSVRALVRDFPGSVVGVGLEQGDDFYFETYDPSTTPSRLSLWRTRGTPETTERLAEFSGLLLTDRRFAPWGDRVAFGADLGDGTGDELAVTTPGGGTSQVADIYAGERGSQPRDLTPLARRMFFSADDGATASRLFRSAGSPATTVPLVQLGQNEFGQRPYDLTAVGNGLFFAEAGAGVGRASLHGPSTQLLLNGSFERFVHEVAKVGSRVVFDRFESEPFPAQGQALRLFASDGTAAGTVPIATLDNETSFGLAYPAPRPEGDGAYWFTRVLLSSGDPTLGALWWSDGTVAGTRKLLDHPCGDCGEAFDWVAARGGRFYFLVDRFGQDNFDLWTTDGTAAGTIRLAQNGPASSRITGSYLTAFDSARGPLVIYTGFDAATGEEPWISDGTVAGTHRLADLRRGAYGSRPREYTVIGSRIYFSADDGRFGRELWVTDGTAAGTRRFMDLLPGRRGSRVQNLTVIDLGGTFGLRLAFSADDGVAGFEPWITDGTLAGTRRLADLNSGPDGSNPSEFTRLGKDLWMSAARPATGYELWRISLGD